MAIRTLYYRVAAATAVVNSAIKTLSLTPGNATHNNSATVHNSNAKTSNGTSHIVVTPNLTGVTSPSAVNGTINNKGWLFDTTGASTEGVYAAGDWTVAIQTHHQTAGANMKFGAQLWKVTVSGTTVVSAQQIIPLTQSQAYLTALASGNRQSFTFSAPSVTIGPNEYLYIEISFQNADASPPSGIRNEQVTHIAETGPLSGDATSANNHGYITTPDFSEPSAGTPVAKDTALQWNDRANAGSEDQVLWNVKKAQSDEAVLRWNVTTPVSDSIDLQWNVRTAVWDSFQTIWNERSATNKNAALQWNVAQAIADNLQAIWHIRTPVNDSVQALWNISAAISDQIALQWNLKAVVNDSAQLVWDITGALAAVQKNVGLQWNLRAALGDTFEARWNLASAISKSIQTQWNARTKVSDSTQAIWNIASSVGKSFIEQWNVQAAVNKTIQTPWNTNSSVQRIQNLTFVSNPASPYVNTQDLVVGSCTAGSTLVLVVSTSTAAVPALGTITDTRGNAWTKVGHSPSADRSVEMWVAPNPSSGANTITVPSVTPDSYIGRQYTFQEFTGLSTSPLDVWAVGTDTGTLHDTAATAPPSQNGEIVVVGIATNVYNATYSITPNSGFVGLLTATTAGTESYTSGASAYKEISAGGAQVGTLTTAESPTSATIVATFKVATAAAPTTPTNFRCFRGHQKARLVCGVVSGATNYDWYRSDTLGGTYTLATTSTLPEVENTGLTNGEDYFYKVKATNNIGESPFSAVTRTIPQPQYGDIELDNSIYVWGKRYLRWDGAAVRPHPDGMDENWAASSDVVSEGQSYALDYYVQSNDQPNFDLAEEWAYNNLDRRNNVAITTYLNLMGWHWDDVSNTMYDWNSAHDADIDRMKALYYADEKWGSAGTINYKARAEAISDDLLSLMRINGVTGKYHLPSDAVQSQYTEYEFNMSYFDPVAYRVAAANQSDTNKRDKWLSALDGDYALSQLVLNFIFAPQTTTAKLPPNFVYFNPTTNTVSPSARNNFDPNNTRYGFDAFRFPYRIYQDGEEYNDSRATSVLADFKTFMIAKWNALGSVKATWEHDGTLHGDYQLAIFDHAAYLAITMNDSANATGAAIYTARLDPLYYSTGGYYAATANDTNNSYFGLSWAISGEMRRQGVYYNYVSTAVSKTLQTVWDTRAVLSDTLQSIWNDRATVFDSLQATWNLRTPVFDSFAAQWGIRSALNDQIQVVWNDRAAVNDSFQAIWNTRTKTFDNLEAMWGIRSTLNDQTQLVWNSRAVIADTFQSIWNITYALSDTSQLVWNTRASVFDSFQALWNLRAPLGKSAHTLWNIQALATDNFQTTWNTRSAIADSFQAVWNAKAPVTNTKQFIWDDRAPLGTTEDFQWNVRSALGITDEFIWGIRTSAFDSIQTVWNTRTATFDSIQALWDTRSALGKERQYLWGTRAAISDSAALQWSLRSLLSTEEQVLWDIRTSVADTLQSIWHIRVPAGMFDLSLQWAARSATGTERDFRWEVLQTALLTTKSLQLIWAQKSLLASSVNPVWDIRKTLTDETALQWSVRTKHSEDLSTLWHTRSIVADSFQTIWNDKALATDNFQAVWNTRSSVFDSFQTIWHARAIAADQLAAVWNTRAVVNDSAILQWNLSALAGQTEQFVWNARALVSDQIQAIWNMKSPATKSTQSIWDIRSVLSNSFQSIWHTRILAGDQAALQWAVKALAQEEIGLVWGVNATTAAMDEIGLRWDIRSLVSDQSVMQWGIRTKAADEITAQWNLRSITQENLVVPWDIRAAASKLSSIEWGTRILASDTTALQWSVRGAVADSVEARWDLKSLTAKQASVQWNVRALTAQLVDTLWNIRITAESTALELRWQILTSAGKSIQTLWDMQSVFSAFDYEVVTGLVAASHLAGQLAAIWKAGQPSSAYAVGDFVVEEAELGLSGSPVTAGEVTTRK